MVAGQRKRGRDAEQRIVSNERSREQLMELARGGAGVLWDTRCNELKQLRPQLLNELVEVAHAAEEKHQQCNRFLQHAPTDHSRVASEELDARAEIAEHRDRDPDEVDRLTEYKRTERNGVAVAEADHQHKVEGREAENVPPSPLHSPQQLRNNTNAAQSSRVPACS